MNIRTALAIASLCCTAPLTACTTLPSLRDVNSTGELLYQGLHAVDVAQTVHGSAEDRCYQESDPVTRRLIGYHPSRMGVIGWGAGWAGLHYAGHAILSGWAPAWVDSVFEAVTIGQAAGYVSHNIQVGVRLGAPNVLQAPCGGDERHIVTDR